jgi:hypothetical protein
VPKVPEQRRQQQKQELELEQLQQAFACQVQRGGGKINEAVRFQRFVILMKTWFYWDHNYSRFEELWEERLRETTNGGAGFLEDELDSVASSMKKGGTQVNGTSLCHRRVVGRVDGQTCHSASGQSHALFARPIPSLPSLSPLQRGRKAPSMMPLRSV